MRAFTGNPPSKFCFVVEPKNSFGATAAKSPAQLEFTRRNQRRYAQVRSKAAKAAKKAAAKAETKAETAAPEKPAGKGKKKKGKKPAAEKNIPVHLTQGGPWVGR